MPLALAFGGVLALGGAVPAAAQGNVCGGVTCETLDEAICDPGGFSVELTSFTPAPTENSGTATYTYQICSPAEGVCSNDAEQECLGNSQCQTNRCQNGGPNANTCSQDDSTACLEDADCNLGITCSRDCAVDEFRGLSHFDVLFPALGGTESCLPDNTAVTGTCSNGNFILGDSSCFDPGTSESFVAKCDNTSLDPGECLTMTVSIPGEENAPGLGTAVLVSKESTDCNESCLAGPSCEPCETENGGDECLTRTRGFWSTHPHIIEELELLPIQVCGVDQTTTDAGVCGTSEALCTNAQDRRGNEPSLTLVAQLTAANLNLGATGEVSEGACGDFEFDETGIEEWIAYCEANFCAANKNAITASGCIEALDAFNNSQDTGFDQTPDPFSRPGPAQVGECQEARGNGKSNYQCVQPPPV